MRSSLGNGGTMALSPGALSGLRLVRAVTVLRRARLRGPIQPLLRTHPQGGPATRRLSGFRRFPVLRRSMLFGSVALGERCTCPLHSVADRCPRSSWLFNARPDSEKVAFVECGLTQSSQSLCQFVSEPWTSLGGKEQIYLVCEQDRSRCTQNGTGV